MASASETLLRIQGEKSPLLGLLEGFAGGVSSAQQNQYARAKAILDLQQQREQQKRMEEEDRMLRQQIEQQTKQALNATNPNAPVMPVQKLEMGIKTNDQGYLARTWKTVEPKQPSYSAEKYKDEKGVVRIGTMNSATGEITRKPTDPEAPDAVGMISPSLSYQMQKDAEKKLVEDKTKKIPGYARTGQVEVDDIEARKMRDAVAESISFQDGLKAYRALIEKHGTSEITDRSVQAQMEAYAKQLQLTVKNMAQLGVLSASDIPFIEKPVPGPGFFKTKAGMLGALDTADAYMKSKVENKLKILGYAKEGASAGSTPPGGSGKVRVSNGKETLEIPSSDLEDAQKDGFSVVP